MSELKISIDKTHYHPGEAIKVRLNWDFDMEDSHEINLNLFWRIECGVKEDTEMLEHQTIESSPNKGQKELIFRAPEHPFSFEFEDAKLVYFIEAYSDGKIRQEASTPFTVAPGDNPVHLQQVD